MKSKLAYIKKNIPQVCEEMSITSNNLMDVISGDSAAIRIPRFCPKEICCEISDRLLMHSERGSFNKANEIERVGMAHFEIDSFEAREAYHRNAIQNTRELREVFSPYLSPVDKIRLELEEIWPTGANLGMFDKKKCFVGITRIMESSVELLAHTDRIDRDSPDCQQACDITSQLSACVYLQVPDEGGGLRLWMSEPSSELEYMKQKDGNYGISIEKLGKPVHQIEPEQGDLIIFNITKLHGVAPGKGKPRINVGAFIGFRGIDKPLTYWS